MHGYSGGAGVHEHFVRGGDIGGHGGDDRSDVGRYRKDGNDMRELIERLELLEYSRGVVVAIKELPKAVIKALKSVGFNKGSITVVPQEKVSLQGMAGEGSRSFAVVVNMETGKFETTYGSWGGGSMLSNPVDRDSSQLAIPPGKGAVITGSEGGGHPVYATLYVHPDTVAGFLPSKAETTERQQSILRMFTYTSAYKKELMLDNNVEPSEVDELVKMGLVKKTASGATSLTVKGKNAIA
jgi:hypothetical protein